MGSCLLRDPLSPDYYWMHQTLGNIEQAHIIPFLHVSQKGGLQAAETTAKIHCLTYRAKNYGRQGHCPSCFSR
jgi:hypothetical protein